MEDGVELVINGAELYALRREPRALSLKEEFRIDTEDGAILAAGLTDIATVDVDNQGRIYAFRRRANSGPLVFRFDDHGRFQNSFLPIGQGPGEVMYPQFTRITNEDELIVVDRGARTVDFFDLDGRLVRKLALPGDLHLLSGGRTFESLANGNFLVVHISVGPNLEVLGIVLTMMDSGLHPIKDLYKALYPGDQIETPFGDFPLFATSNRAVFVVSYQPGSDIAIYDLDGVLVRRIRLDYPTPEVSASFREAFLSLFPPDSAQVKSLRFPDHFPHVQAMFTDDAGRLFISSFGKDGDSGANICDVFTPGGARIIRTALGYQDINRFAAGETFDVAIKNGRAYCIHEKDDGFKEIVVYALKWSREAS